MALTKHNKGNNSSFSRTAKPLGPHGFAAGRKQTGNSTFCFIISFLILIKSRIKETAQWKRPASY